MRRPRKYEDGIVTGLKPREFMFEAYKYAYNMACGEWEKWHEELRLALGAQPGDDLIDFARNSISDDKIKGLQAQLDTSDRVISGLNSAISKLTWELDHVNEVVKEQKELIAKRDQEVKELDELLSEANHKWMSADTKLDRVRYLFNEMGEVLSD